MHPEPIEYQVIIIEPDEAGDRLDKTLAKHFEGLFSRTYFQYLIEHGKVLVNGDPVKKREKLIAGDEIEIAFQLTPEMTLEPEAIPLDIIYEDDAIIVINKPAGMVVHPAPGHPTGTFVHGLLYHCRTLPRGEGLRPGIVHRLDKETTGLLIAAKTDFAHQKLVEAFASRQVHKEYLAVALGEPGQRRIEAPIGRHPIHRQQMSIQEKGKPAMTDCIPLATTKTVSLIRLILHTGRTHQIRVHLKSINCPIVGDPVYGDERYNKKHGIRRQLLHAARLRLQHPVTHEILEWTAPMPYDMLEFIKQQRLAPLLIPNASGNLKS